MALPGRLELSIDRASLALEAVLELPVGGTAVGSGINTHPEFGRRVAAALAAETGIAFVEADNHFEANAQRDGLVECHAQLKTIATTLFNVANNIRWLGSGPRCGFFEVSLPERAARQLDYARQGQPGDVREPDASCCSGHRQRSNADHVRRSRR